jgi:hypothetical protein
MNFAHQTPLAAGGIEHDLAASEAAIAVIFNFSASSSCNLRGHEFVCIDVKLVKLVLVGSLSRALSLTH